jgi:hypothetical protein
MLSLTITGLASISVSVQCVDITANIYTLERDTADNVSAEVTSERHKDRRRIGRGELIDRY